MSYEEVLSKATSVAFRAAGHPSADAYFEPLESCIDVETDRELGDASPHPLPSASRDQVFLWQNLPAMALDQLKLLTHLGSRWMTLPGPTQGGSGGTANSTPSERCELELLRIRFSRARDQVPRAGSSQEPESAREPEAWVPKRSAHRLVLRPSPLTIGGVFLQLFFVIERCVYGYFVAFISCWNAILLALVAMIFGYCRLLAFLIDRLTKWPMNIVGVGGLAIALAGVALILHVIGSR